MTFLDYLKNGDVVKATEMLESVLKNKTLQTINEHRAEVSEAVYGSALDEDYLTESSKDYTDLHKAALAAGYEHKGTTSSGKKSKDPDYHHYAHPNGHTMSVSVSRGVHGLYGKPKGQFQFMHAAKDMDKNNGTVQSGTTVNDFKHVHGKAEGK